MKKITLLFLMVLATTLGFAQNLFTDGTFDNPSAWTVIQQNGNNNATAVVAGGVATFNVVDGTATWGAEGHVAIYKTFTVPTTGEYEFDADATTNGVDEHWFEVHVGTAAPVDGVEYNATLILTLHSWDCGATTNTYSGSMIATGCKGLDGKIQLDAGTTYYYLVRTGGITWGTGVILDNITMVANTLSTKDFQIEGLSTYPNPTTDTWNISTKNQVINSIEVFNILGKRELALQPNALSAKVDASNLTSGIYITKISTALGTVSKKLIKH